MLTLALAVPPEKVIAWLLFLGAAVLHAANRPKLGNVAGWGGLCVAFWPW